MPYTRFFVPPRGNEKGDSHRPSSALGVIFHVTYAWNGLGEYAAAKLRKGDHIYVEGTLVSSTYQKEFGKGKNKITLPLKTWQVKADSIRKLNRAKKDQVPDTAPLSAQPEEVPF
jgi:single-stranded DNA-binding protein